MCTCIYIVNHHYMYIICTVSITCEKLAMVQRIVVLCMTTTWIIWKLIKLQNIVNASNEFMHHPYIVSSQTLFLVLWMNSVQQCNTSSSPVICRFKWIETYWAISTFYASPLSLVGSFVCIHIRVGNNSVKVCIITP